MTEHNEQEVRTILADLPEECIVHALSFLDSPRDVLGFEATCKRFWRLGKAPEAWMTRLRKHFDLRLQAVGEQPLSSLQELYTHTAITATDRLLRFTGIFTDGGCDNNMAQYWVDNLFQANHWHSFCSALGHNVNCIGVMMEPDPYAHWPDQERHHRNYIINRCLLAHGMLTRTIQNMGPFGIDNAERDRERQMLDRLSTAELEHLLAELFAEHQQRTRVGRLLFCEVSPRNLDAEIERVEGIVRELLLSEKRTVRHLGISARKKMDVLMDGPTLKRLAADKHKRQHAGVIEGLSINRVGNFSCPVSTGVVFVANMPAPEHPDDPFKKAANDFAARIHSNACSSFNGMSGGSALFECSQRGTLPPIIASSRNHAGKWCEFDPDWQDPRDAASSSAAALRPIAWFQFWTREEAFSYVRCMRELQRDPATGARLKQTLSVAEMSEICCRMHIERTPPLPDLLFADNDCHKDMSTDARAMRPEFLRWEHLVQHFGQEQEERIFGSHADNFITEPDEDGNPVISNPCLNINQLDFTLTKKRAGNLVLVKVIDQEDLMDLWSDEHDEPNIDVTYVAFKGRQLLLPPGVQLAC